MQITKEQKMTPQEQLEAIKQSHITNKKLLNMVNQILNIRCLGLEKTQKENDKLLCEIVQKST